MPMSPSVVLVGAGGDVARRRQGHAGARQRSAAPPLIVRPTTNSIDVRHRSSTAP
jgi:hypothetical protein